MRRFSLTRILLGLVGGALIEMLFDKLLGYSQAPGFGIFFLILAPINQTIRTESLLGLTLTIIAALVAVLVQSAVMGIPIWLAIIALDRYRGWRVIRSTNPPEQPRT